MPRDDIGMTKDDAKQLLIATSRLALQKLEQCCPDAPEVALLLFAIRKAEGQIRRKADTRENLTALETVAWR